MNQEETDISNDIQTRMESDLLKDSVVSEHVYETVPVDTSDATPEKRIDVLEFLKANPDRAFTAKFIAKAVNLPTRGTSVEVRKCVAELRDMGHPIISSCEGFEYTENPAKINECIVSLYQRIAGIQRSIYGLRKAAERFDNDSVLSVFFK